MTTSRYAFLKFIAYVIMYIEAYTPLPKRITFCRKKILHKFLKKNIPRFKSNICAFYRISWNTIET